MATPADRIGQLIGGKYQVTKVLGSGGMGAVYAATNIKLRHEVALKVINSDDKTVIDRFGREARTLAQLSHPNTISVFDFGRDEGVLYLAMEKLEGQSLEEALARYLRFSAFDAVSVAQQVAASLTEAHNAGIVHRDIKPANIFLTRGEDAEYFVKVLDFGIAKTFTADAETKLTREGSLVGTPRYMAPEQIRTQQVDQRSDIYALACVLYEMLSGRPPFLADNMADLLIQHLKENVPPLSRFVPADELRHIPPDLDSVIHRALAKDPRMRQQSMDEFCRDLEIALGQMQSGIVRPEMQSTVSVEAPRPGTKSLEMPRPERAEKRPERAKKKSRFVPIAGALFVMMCIAVVGVLVTRGETSGDTCQEDGAVICGRSEFGSPAVLGCRKGRLGTLAACEVECQQALVGGASCGDSQPIIAIEDGYCNVAHVNACSSTADAILQCAGLKWNVVRRCVPLQCEKTEAGIQCQNNTYGLGDDCDFSDEVRACSTNFAHLLGCEDGVTQIDTDCSEAKGRCTELNSGDLREVSCHVFNTSQDAEADE